MAFLRFARDKRGVESFALVHATTNRRGKVRPRVLYWFRTPPDIKVGREPFDPVVRRALEAQYPDIPFDWRAILETPIPSADADKWRERRRAERAAKHAARVEEAAEADVSDTEPDERGDSAIAESAEPAVADMAVAPAIGADAAPPRDDANRGHDPNRKRRRRRRSSGGRSGPAPSAGAPTPPPASGGEPSGD